MPSRSGFVRVGTSSFNLSALILNGSPLVSILTRTAPPSSESSTSFSESFFQSPQVISAVSKLLGSLKAASSRTVSAADSPRRKTNVRSRRFSSGTV